MTKDKKQKNAHLWVRDPDDWYVENDWCADALFEKIAFDGPITDPACGIGRVLDSAKRNGYRCNGFDIKCRDNIDQRHVFAIADFFATKRRYKNIVSNPPYKYDDEFLRVAIARTDDTVALLLRTQWANGSARSAWLEKLPLAYKLDLTPRPSMPPGAVILAGDSPGGGQTDYAWYVFRHGYQGEPKYGWARRPAHFKARAKK